MDKKSEQEYKCSMRIPFIYSAAFATLLIILAVDLGLQHLASATQELIGDTPRVQRPEGSFQPIVFARYAAGDGSFTAQPIEQTLHCVSEAFSGASDLCGPLPVLTSASIHPSTLPKWQLTKLPAKIFWQQDVPNGRQVVVELRDSNGPLKGGKSFRKGDKESVVITLGTGASSQDLFLVADVKSVDGKRLENWVLPISVKSKS
jgi:hypothetical protein